MENNNETALVCGAVHDSQSDANNSRATAPPAAPSSPVVRPPAPPSVHNSPSAKRQAPPTKNQPKHAFNNSYTHKVPFQRSKLPFQAMSADQAIQESLYPGTGPGDSSDNLEEPDAANTAQAKDHVVYVTGYLPFVRANDLIRVFARFGPAHCDRRTARGALIRYERPEHAAAAVAAGEKGLLSVYGAPVGVAPFSILQDQLPTGKRKGPPPLAVPPEDLDLSGDFEEQLAVLLARVQLTREEVERLAMLYSDVERALQPIWPGCKAVPFGSITTGLGTKASDADCFVDVPARYNAVGGGAVNRARRVLQQWPQVFAEVLAIPRASTPIVKLLHVPTATKCDLSFKTPLGALNSRLVAHMLHRAPPLPQLAVLLKYWAHVHALTGTGRLSNYALVMLLLHYLQQCEPPLLPPVQALQLDPARHYFVGHWNAGFDERAQPAPPCPAALPALPDLLAGFFRYYAHFDFERLVVSPYLGRPAERAAFAEPAALPDDFALYRRNVLREVEPPLRLDTPWCVQDPFVHAHNVASGISAPLAAELLAYVQFACGVCEAEAARGHRATLRRLLLERPQLARRSTVAQFNMHLRRNVLDEIAGADWRASVRRATADVFERILGAALERLPAPGDDKDEGERDRFAVRVERQMWRQRKRRRPPGAAALAFLEREVRTSEAMQATADRCAPPLNFHMVIKFGRGERRSASVSIRLTEGDVAVFRDLGNFMLSIAQTWYRNLLLDRRKSAEPSDGALDTTASDGVSLAPRDSDDEAEAPLPAPQAPDQPEDAGGGGSESPKDSPAKMLKTTKSE